MLVPRTVVIADVTLAVLFQIPDVPVTGHLDPDWVSGSGRSSRSLGWSRCRRPPSPRRLFFGNVFSQVLLKDEMKELAWNERLD